MRKTSGKIAIVAVLFLLSFGRQACAMSDDQEISIGRQASAEVDRRYGVWHDKKWDPILQRIGDDLVKHTTRPLPYTFKFADMKEANAFALPGGFVYVTRGLVAYLETEGELAAVLSHEVSHVELKHFQKMVTRQNTMNIIGIVAMVLTHGAARPFLNVASILDNFVLEPKYSRAQETQADLNGVKLMVEMGRDPYDMIRLFEEFERKEKSHSILPIWMHDHPDFPVRIAAVQQEIAKYPGVPPRTAPDRVLSGKVLPDSSTDPRSAVSVNRDSSGNFLVQWIGEPAGISQIEFDGKNADGDLVSRAVAPHLPFMAALHANARISSVDAILTYADGSTAKLTFPVNI